MLRIDTSHPLLCPGLSQFITAHNGTMIPQSFHSQPIPQSVKLRAFWVHTLSSCPWADRRNWPCPTPLQKYPGRSAAMSIVPYGKVT